jgi:poly(hydroxyalkanoate) granule-associated protein
MATRKRTRARGSAAGSRTRGESATASASALLSGVQQLLLAGMGAVSRAQHEGPAAFTDAVGEGLKLLGKSRENAEKLVRDALEAAQDSVQSRLDGAREQAGETWDNLELLFQTRVQRALQQIGVPTADEIRLLTRRVGELNEAVKTLTIRVEGGRKAKLAPVRRTASKKKAAPRKAGGGRRKAKAPRG